MPKVRRLINFDPDLLERIDAARGDVPLAAWVRRACEHRLQHGPPIGRDPNSVFFSPEVEALMPVETDTTTAQALPP